jgi:nicotinamidase/pyrazinamidase
LGYQVFLLQDAIRAVNVKPDDGEKAIKEMTDLGAIPIRYEMIS